MHVFRCLSLSLTSKKEDSRKKSKALALGIRLFWFTMSPAVQVQGAKGCCTSFETVYLHGTKQAGIQAAGLYSKALVS